MSHTKGPWKIDANDRVKGPEGNTVADCRYKNGRDNSRLIAAAPELLSELVEVLDWAQVEKAPLRKQEIDSIRAVIAKATGGAQ